MDASLLLYINSSCNAFLDGIMLQLSATTTWSLMAMCLVAIIVRNMRLAPALFSLFALALAILIADQVCSGMLKPLVQRLRPTHEPTLMFRIYSIGGRGGLYGFCSSHAGNVFAVATIVSLLLRHKLTTCILMIWACLVSYSRIYLGMHYPTDVIAGALIGVLSGLICYGLLRMCIIRFSPQPTQYYSSAYTTSGFAINDIHDFHLSVAITFVYAIMAVIIF